MSSARPDNMTAVSTAFSAFWQAYVPYHTRSLPIPTTVQPRSVGWVSNVTFPDVIDSALFALADGATSYFGLRFTGAAVRVRNA